MGWVSTTELQREREIPVPHVHDEARAAKIAAVTARLQDQYRKWQEADDVPRLNDPVEVLGQGGHAIVHAAGNLAVRSARNRTFRAASYVANMALGDRLDDNLEQLVAVSDTHVYGKRIRGTSFGGLRTEDLEQLGPDDYRRALQTGLTMQNNGLATDRGVNTIVNPSGIHIFDYRYKPDQPLTKKVDAIGEMIVYGGMGRIYNLEGETAMRLEMMSRIPHVTDFVAICDEAELADPVTWAGARDAAIEQARIVDPGIVKSYL